MTADYKPGTVARISMSGVGDVVALRSPNEGWVWIANDGRDGFHHYSICAEDAATDVRPLVVLDMHPAGCVGDKGLRVENVLNTLRDSNFIVCHEIADQVEAQTRPLKPAEPTGLGAVVEDAEGDRWVRCDNDAARWYTPDLEWATYDAIDVARVLTEGIRP